MKYIPAILLFFCVLSSINSQSIRKNYQEMTTAEKDALVSGFYELRNGADLINDLAQFHSDNFNFGNSEQLDIHFNLPNEPQRQIFFSWHRMQMFEMEQALQKIDPNISLPWWDSSEDQSPNSALFDFNFMGQFNITWGLNRNLGNDGPLPTPQTITNVQSLADFLIYANQMERGDAHRGAHVWVGGAMRTPLSPRDPIFHLHHTYIDKLWRDWVLDNPGSSSFIITSMIRYDGTYTFDGETLPLVNPNDIINSEETLGVFYAENGLAELHNYVVKNNTQDLENFYYQFTIDVGNGFVVPANTNCRTQSINEINLIPGFEAVNGSNFVAAIDIELNTKQPSIIVSRDKDLFDYDPAIQNVNAYDTNRIEENLITPKIYPNPFTDVVTIDLQQEVKYLKVEIFDMSGRLLLIKNSENRSSLIIPEVKIFNSGLYMINVVVNGKMVLSSKMVKN